VTLDITQQQRDNLAILARYLESLPKGYKHFDMLDYVGENVDEELLYQYAKKNGGIKQLGCATVACAVGHGPAAGILVPERFLSITGILWFDYTALMFTRERELQYYLFAYYWSSSDNHPWGAAARIRCVLAEDAVPTDQCVAYYAKYRITRARPLPRAANKAHKATPPIVA
jgi:hypothetical protein